MFERLYRVFRETLCVFVRQDVYARDVPALTYSTLKALIPVLALMYVLARALGCDAMLEGWIRDTLQSQPTTADYLVDFVHNYLANTQSRYILIIGLALMLYTLYNLMLKIEKTFNRFWDAPTRHVGRRLLAYPAIFLFCCIMVLVASGLNILAVTLSRGIDSLPYIGTLTPLVALVFTVVPLFFFFMFIYSFVPNTRVRFLATLWPSLLAAVCMALLQFFYVKAQVALVSYNVIYGSLAALPLFLLWLQFLWSICLFCGVLTCSGHRLMN